MMADELDYLVDSIHPPDVVLFSSNQTSPDHHASHICSPLSSAPNSPSRVSFDEDEDDEEDDDRPNEGIEVRAEEILELLETPCRIPTSEVPFDEGRGGTFFDPLLGNPRLRQGKSQSTLPARVSPLMAMHEDIDAYVEEDEDDEDNESDEKKDSEEPAQTSPTENTGRLPIYPAYSASRKPTAYSQYPRVNRPTTALEDDSMPHDERQCIHTTPFRDFIESTRSNADGDGDGDHNHVEASQMADREVQEVERRVQKMMERRRNSDSGSQQLFGGEHDPKPTPPQNTSHATKKGESTLEGHNYEMNEQPPSLHTSLDSGGSSYYYDGSAMGSSPTDDVNNTTLESVASSTLGGKRSDARSTHPPLEATSAEPYPSAGERGTTSSFSYEAFASTSNGALARIVTGTSHALNQVSDEWSNFLAIPSFEPQSTSSKVRPPPKTRANNYNPPPKQQYLPMSPSQDSECTPHVENLSPRHKSKKEDLYLLYRERPSEKLAKARYLVSERNAKSPTAAQYMKDDPRQRALQVMNKRERDRPSPTSKRSNGDRTTQKESGTADSTNIPAPPNLYRVAARMEGLGGVSAEEMDRAAKGSRTDVDWPKSVSQLMGVYQTAITESLRNLSMDEISGLAQNGEYGKLPPSFGSDNGASPAVSLLPSSYAKHDDTTNFQSLEEEEVDGLIETMTFGTCLQMTELDHQPCETSHDTGTMQQPKISKDYAQGVAGVLQYDAGMEYHYHSTRDEQFHDEKEQDPEYHERAVFAKQLSDKLMTLAENASIDSDSAEDQQPSRTRSDSFRVEHGTAFDAEPSSFISPPKRGRDDNRDSMAHNAKSKGLFTSNLPPNGDLPHSGQASVSSDNVFATPDRATPISQEGGETSAWQSFNTTGENTADIKPTMVESIDNEIGISKGDVMLSLLCDNSFQASLEKPDSWAWRVREAIWRGRQMRSDREKSNTRLGKSRDDGDHQPQSWRSLPVDVDAVRVVGGIRNVSFSQEKALAHLERDEFEQALELYEDIIFNYYSFFEQVLAKRHEYSPQDITKELSNFKPYIGASLHNLGVIHLLKGDYEDAFSFLKRAVDNRRSCLGDAHPDCVTSLVRLATCRFATDNFADAHSNLELALALAGSTARTTSDYSQLGEILNNLGCLSYMCGQPTKAMRLFRESLDVQLAVLNSTLYGGAKYSAHSATLNISVTRGNVGFLALVLRDVSSGIMALEACLREQRLLLSGAHVTLVSTMDHLAVANLLEGRSQKALKMLRRIYELQISAHGPKDPRCLATKQKMMTIRGQQHGDITRATPGSGRRHRDTMHEEVAKSTRPGIEQQDSGRQGQAYEEGKRSYRQIVENTPSSRNTHRHTGESMSSARSTSIPSSNLSNGGSNSNGKVNSVFKAIRSMGQKKKGSWSKLVTDP